MWPGLLIGFFAGGLLLRDFGAAVAFSIVGAFIGSALSRRSGKSNNDGWVGDEPASAPTRADFHALRDELLSVKARLTDLEQRLGNDSDAPDTVKTVVTEEPRVSDDPLPQHAQKTLVTPQNIPDLKREAPKPQPPKPPPEPAKPTPPPAPPVQPPPPAKPNPLFAFVHRWFISGNPLVKVGVLVLFLGVGFLLRYAAERAVFPIEFRYLAVAILGIALLVMGWRWRERKDTYGLTMQGAGIGVLYLTTLAALKLHPILPVAAGFTILVAVAALAAYLAVKQDALIMAIVASLCGFAAPVLASTGSGNHLALFSYLTVLNLGIVAIAWFKSWRFLNIIGYVCSFALGSLWATKYYEHELFATTEPFLLLLFVMYVIVTLLFARRRLASDDKSISYVDGTLAFGVPFSAFWVQHILVEPFQYGAAISAVGFGAFYFLLSYVLVSRSGRRYKLLTETLTALGVVFFTLAIPLLETSWTAAAWGAEAAGVYWIGTRQKQLHARFFALLLLFGAMIDFLPELSWTPGGNVLDGSVLSAALLTAGAGFTYWLMWQNRSGGLHNIEERLSPVIAWFAMFFLATIPLLLLERQWAAPALAIVGTALIYISLRMSDSTIRAGGWLYQLLAGLLFASTIKMQTGDVILASGWTGLLITTLIGSAIVVGFWQVDSNSEKDKNTNSLNTLALLVGLAIINLAPMFVLSWRYSAMIWPVTALITFVWATRSRNLGAILFALSLQVLAGIAHSYSRVNDLGYTEDSDSLTTLLNSQFLGAVIIAAAALIGAWFAHRKQSAHHRLDMIGWLAIGWSVLWWSIAWITELSRVVADDHLIGALVITTIATAWFMTEIASRAGWHQLRTAALVYVPILAVLALADYVEFRSHPLHNLGAIAWPLALVAHAVLLRRVEAKAAVKLARIAHLLGAWVFVYLISSEVSWWFGEWTSPATAWPILGWCLVPALYLWALSRDSIRAKWPVQKQPMTYVVESATPVVILLLIAVWSLAASNSGSADPLPYVPVLNPLDIANIVILFSVVSWWRQLPPSEGIRRIATAFEWLIRATAFVMLTAAVVRACHHLADVAWRASALFESSVVQTSLSVVWGMLAIGLMLLGHKRRKRIVWISGATLVGVVVIKLFVIELSASGSLERIVSFIVVGLLLLFVGYVAPMPPSKKPQEESPT